jgi:hypothetical protein
MHGCRRFEHGGEVFVCKNETPESQAKIKSSAAQNFEESRVSNALEA